MPRRQQQTQPVPSFRVSAEGCTLPAPQPRNGPFALCAGVIGEDDLGFVSAKRTEPNFFKRPNEPGRRNISSFNKLSMRLLHTVRPEKARRHCLTSRSSHGCGPHGAAVSSLTSCVMTSGRNFEAKASTKSLLAKTPAQCLRRSVSSSNFQRWTSWLIVPLSARK